MFAKFKFGDHRYVVNPFQVTYVRGRGDQGSKIYFSCGKRIQVDASLQDVETDLMASGAMLVRQAAAS